MRKLLYVGHKFHLRTGSTKFLLDILKKHFAVQILAVDPADPLSREMKIDASSHDLILIFQMDYLAPIYIAQGKPTIVVPMLDGSGEMPSIHWEFSNQARFISFSRKLHANIRRAGGNSLLLKFFPEPVIEKDAAKFGDLAAFFWQRRPDYGFDLDLVGRLLGDKVEAIYFHDAPDVGSVFGKRNTLEVQKKIKANIVRSEWFRNKADYDRVLQNANLFVAPRLAEGIGMGFLEAMARGMVVLANNAGTHNEYISDGVNGILYDHLAAELPDLELIDLTQMGGRARETVFSGRKAWEMNIPELVDFIETAPAPDGCGVDPGVLVEQLPKAYYSGATSYIKYLRRNATKVRQLSPALSELRSRRLIRKAVNEPVIRYGAELNSQIISFADGAARRFLLTGWSEDEEQFVWMTRRSAALQFAADESLWDSTVCLIRCHSASTVELNQEFVVILNDVLIGNAEVGAAASEIAFSLPNGLAALNRIQIVCAHENYVPPDHRCLVLAIHFLEFS